MNFHSNSAAKYLNSSDRAKKVDGSIWFLKQARDSMINSDDVFQNLRTVASNIKNKTLANLDEYLLQFEANAIKNNIKIHWAANNTEFNNIVLKIIKDKQYSKVIKSKSMLTEETGLNHFLEKHAVEIIDSDLGERIIQFRKERPSHIVIPAIHLSREEIGQTFHEKIGSPKGESDPATLTNIARKHLRDKFLNAEVAVTGVNFAVAATGTVVVCTNEGNADLGTSMAKVHIACMGIEKIIPDLDSLGVFTRLLARSATGAPITTYTSHFTRPAPGCEMHVVLLDSMRSSILGDNDHWESLKCIRCAACMNTCPVYRRSGGYSYNYLIPGPIGTILAPSYDINKYDSLPFASTLCGSCSNVCPVKINIHEQIYKWRQTITKQQQNKLKNKLLTKVLVTILSSPKVYNIGSSMLKLVYASNILKLKFLNPWYKQRELPKLPQQSFKQWYKENKK
ncbi:MAG: lactate utilization protein B [Burkholderiales bacterium]|nr:lactate utilization protein B [Burkholderiales bacterium]